MSTANLSLPHEFALEPITLIIYLFIYLFITEEFVLRQLKQLKTNKAVGRNSNSVRLLKDSALVISSSLTRLFKHFLETRTFPSLSVELNLEK